MKRPKLTALDYANAMESLANQIKEIKYLLAIYKEALSLACYEMANTYTNERATDEYWLKLAIQEIAKLKEVSP